MSPDERTVRELLAALDGGDTAQAMSLLSEDIHFRFGSAEPVVGHSGLAAQSTALHAVVASMSHDILSVWTVDEPASTVICDMAVTYERHDGVRLTLPCVNIFSLRDGRIVDYRIYMDINPVFAHQPA
jgi:ketosteroid isomerase-like protein